MMRWLHLAVIGLLALAVVVFAWQNLQAVTIAFLGLRLQAPLAILIVVVYLLGMATGSSLFALLKWSIAGARERQAP